MSPAVTILMVVMMMMMMRVSAQDDISAMCEKNPPVPCKQNLRDGPWYQLDDNRCVRAFFYTDYLDFSSAEFACSKYTSSKFYGHLVSMTSATELNKVICAMYKVHPGKPHYWIGLRRLNLRDGLVPAIWAWTDDKGVDFTNWARGQPDNYMLCEGCVEMNYWSWGLWNDAACWDKKPYACEVRLY